MYLVKKEIPSNQCQAPSQDYATTIYHNGCSHGALGSWSPKYIIYIICLPFRQFEERLFCG